MRAARPQNQKTSSGGRWSAPKTAWTPEEMRMPIHETRLAVP